MIHRLVSAAACAAFLGCAILPAAAQTIESIYTKFDAKACKHTRGKDAEDYGAWHCRGYGKVGIVLGAGDQRMYVSFGAGKKTDKKDLAASQTFPGFNDVYSGTVEWRVEKPVTGKPWPFATILRWNVVTASDQEKAKGPVKPSGRVLVVTRLGPGGVCHVGYVDAVANPDANELARKIADEHARKFRCGKDKRVVLGKVSPGLAMPGDKE